MPGQKWQLYGRNDGLGRNGGGHCPDRGCGGGARRTHLGRCITSYCKEQQIWLKQRSFSFPSGFQTMPSRGTAINMHPKKRTWICPLTQLPALSIRMIQKQSPRSRAFMARPESIFPSCRLFACLPNHPARNPQAPSLAARCSSSFL
jgi:hypothetical protein